MYNIKTATCWRVRNLLTGEVSKWTQDPAMVPLEVRNMVRKHENKEFYIARIRIFARISESGCLEYYTDTHRVGFGLDAIIVTGKRMRYIVVETYSGEYLSRDTVMEMEMRHKSYQPGYEFRNGPVSMTGKGRYYGYNTRPIRYKHTLMAFDDPDCREYAVKPGRKRTKVHKFDVRHVRCFSRSWKDQRKTEKQWQR